MKHHYYLIVNSNAGSGRGKKIGEELIDLLKTREEEYTAYFTTYAGEEVEITTQLANSVLKEWEKEKVYENFPLLIVLGGDGTLHQVLNALTPISTKIPVSYVPAGSGNDFARGISLVRNDALKAFEEILEAKQPKEVHMIAYHENNTQNEGLVVNNFGVGLDASVVAATNSSKSKTTLNKYKLGSFAYIWSMIQILFTQKSFDVMVNNGDRKTKISDVLLATTTNHPYFGGGVAISPEASAFQNEFDLIVIEKKNILQILILLIKLTKGTHMTSPYVHRFSLTKLHLQTKTKQYGQKDGETIAPQEFNLNFESIVRLIWV